MRISVNEQIYLSEFDPSDKPAIVAHLREREIADNTLRIPYPYSEADANWWIEHVEKTTAAQGQPSQWAIREMNSFLIGGCDLHDFSIGKSHRAEIGYWLAKPYWGRGIMTDVVQSVCLFGFSHFGLIRISAQVFPTNPASARVLVKSGFVNEGRLRKQHYKDGQYLDADLYALVK